MLPVGETAASFWLLDLTASMTTSVTTPMRISAPTPAPTLIATIFWVSPVSEKSEELLPSSLGGKGGGAAGNGGGEAALMVTLAVAVIELAGMPAKLVIPKPPVNPLVLMSDTMLSIADACAELPIIRSSDRDPIDDCWRARGAAVPGS
jgi:hypothetical protein